MTTTEIHAFVLWPYALAKREKILPDIASRFTILEILEVRWPEAAFSRNLSRFYSSKLPPGSDKERHCGRGPFLLVIVRDEAPTHALRPTSKGQKQVNARMFDARAAYRRRTGGGHRVHATLTSEETEHDLFLLLGYGADSYGPETPPWNGELVEYSHELVGANGWRDGLELFRALDVTTSCALLSPPEESDGSNVLLTDNLWDSIMIANGRQRIEDGRVAHDLQVGGQRLTLDLVQMRAGYLDQRWEQLIVAQSVEKGGARVARADDRFYAALYGRVVRGEAEPDDSLLHALAAEAGISLGAEWDAGAVLDDFLDRHGFGRPQWRPPVLDTGSGFFVQLPVLADSPRPAAGLHRAVARIRLGLSRLESGPAEGSPGGGSAVGSGGTVVTDPSAAVTGVVVSHNTRTYLENCLSELSAAGLESIVVDSASSDGSVEAVRARFPDVEMIELTENRGFGAAANEAMRRVRTPWILLLNADAWPRGDPIPRLVGLADRDVRLGAVAPGLLNLDGSPQRSVFGYPRRPLTLAAWAASPRTVSLLFTVWRQIGQLWASGRTPLAGAGGCRLLRRNDFPLGAALLLRREAVEEVGGFDERFFMYSEETDLCQRLQDRGWRIGYCPEARFVHVGGASTRQRPDEMYREQLVSYLRFLAKHAGLSTADRARRLTAVTLRLRARISPAARRKRCRETARWLAKTDVTMLL